MHKEPSYDDLRCRVAELENHALARRQAEDVMVWENLFNRPLVDGLPAGLGLYDEEMRLLMHNRIYTDFLRTYSPCRAPEYVGLDHYIIKPGSRPYSETMFRHVLHSRQAHTTYDFELHIMQEAGEQVSFWDVHIAPVLDRHGRPRGMLMYCLDLTQRKLSQRQALPPGPLEPGEVEDLKAAIRTLLKMKEEENREREQRIHHNVRHRILPQLERLKGTPLNPEQKGFLREIEMGLKRLTSSFAETSFTTYYQLTPREIEVAELIKDGRSSKEIADLLRVAKGSVDFHRNNIRRKLGLDNTRVNLRAHLLSLER